MNRVLLGQVGAPGHQAVGVFEVLVTTGRAVGAEGALVAGHGRGHAQGRVAIIVVGTDQPARELAEHVELLGQHLPGGDNSKGIR